MSSVMSDKRKIIFIHLTKTGGSTVEKILLEQPPDFKPLRDNIVKDRRQWWSMVHKHKALEEKVQTYEVFTVVRNPVDRYISAYNDFFHTRYKERYCQAGVSFTDSVNSPGMMRSAYPAFYAHACVPMIKSLPKLKYINKIIRFENFEAELKKYLLTIGIYAPEKLPHARRSRKVITTISMEDRKVLEERFKKDMEVFGYEIA